MKNEFIENKRVTDGDLRELREQSKRIEKEIEILRNESVKSNISEEYNENNKTFRSQSSKCDVMTSECDVVTSKYDVTNPIKVHGDEVKLRRQRFGELRRTLSSTSIPSEHDDENTEYTPLVNKTKKIVVNDDKEKEYVFKYVDSLPSSSSATTTMTSENICEMTTKKIENGFVDQSDILSAATVAQQQQQHQHQQHRQQEKTEETKPNSPTTDNDRSSSKSTVPTNKTKLPIITNNQDGGMSCSGLLIPRITITDTVAAFYHFENATDQQSPVYMNEE